MKVVQVVKKLNSISRERLNFRRRLILCTTLYRNPIQASNFGGTFDQLFLWIFYAIFTQDASLLEKHACDIFRQIPFKKELRFQLPKLTGMAERYTEVQTQTHLFHNHRLIVGACTIQRWQESMQLLSGLIFGVGEQHGQDSRGLRKEAQQAQKM